MNKTEKIPRLLELTLQWKAQKTITASLVAQLIKNQPAI